MGILANPKGIIVAALVGSAAITVLGQSPIVLTGAAAYGDWRTDAPGVRRKITPADMPPAYETASANHHPTVVARPANAWPKAPPGFVVELLASGLDNPRAIRVAPNGDIFIAESEPGRIRVLRAAGSGKPPEIRTFVEGLYQPFGIAFWPPGPDPRYVYIANTDNVVRFPYRLGDLQPAGPAEAASERDDREAVQQAPSVASPNCRQRSPRRSGRQRREPQRAHPQAPSMRHASGQHLQARQLPLLGIPVHRPVEAVHCALAR